MSPATRKPDWRSGPALAGYALAVTALLTAVYAGTQPHIAASEARARRALMAEVLPPAQHDNDLLQAAFTLPPTPELGVQRSGTAWRAMRGGQTVAVVLEAIAPDGYAGPIRLLIGIDRSGRLTGVRVLAHRETPGLGDYIEVGRGPWILQFAGSSLQAPQRWQVKKDGGHFDHMTGATVTPRAIVRAVHRALLHVGQQHAFYFGPTSAKGSAP